jgi:hypothetical protein
MIVSTRCRPLLTLQAARNLYACSAALLKNTVSSPRKQFRQHAAAAVLQDGPVPARITPSLPIAIALIRP